MTPTNELRFVERTKTELGNAWQGGPVYITRTERVLQQWWKNDPYHGSNSALGINGEWRDVPLVKENAAPLVQSAPEPKQPNPRIWP